MMAGGLFLGLHDDVPRADLFRKVEGGDLLS
jgi:hypothetical protein